MDNKIVHQFAGKLGLLGETTVLEKASELLRLLTLKGTSLTQIGDYARCVICLDLSTSLYGYEFDSQMALKLSGFKKPSYLNSRRLIEKLLDLNKPMGVSEIAIQLNLTEIQASSQTMLDRFVSSSDLRNIDTTHPQYGAMAVYQMCRLRKIKIQKTKLISFSHLKPSQWSVLEKSWESWTKANPDKIQDFLPLKKGKSAAQSTETTAAASNHGEEKSEPITKIVEEYEDWKERVLKKAFEDLERQKMVH